MVTAKFEKPATQQTIDIAGMPKYTRHIPVEYYLELDTGSGYTIKRVDYCTYRANDVGLYYKTYNSHYRRYEID